jgi:hypothetical protein
VGSDEKVLVSVPSVAVKIFVIPDPSSKYAPAQHRPFPGN